MDFEIWQTKLHRSNAFKLGLKCGQFRRSNVSILVSIFWKCDFHYLLYHFDFHHANSMRLVPNVSSDVLQHFTSNTFIDNLYQNAK